MLKAFFPFRSTARLGALCSGAAILLSACGGASGLGDRPQTLNENMPGSVTASAISAGSVDVNQGGQQTAVVAAQAAPLAAAVPAEPSAPAYGASAAAGDADTVVYPPSEENNVSAPSDAAAAQDGTAAAQPPAV